MTMIVRSLFPNISCHSSDNPCNVIALWTSPNGSSEKTSRRVQIDYTDSDDQINNDINDEDDDDYDDDDADDDEVNVGDRLLPEEQLLNCLAVIGYARTTSEDYKNNLLGGGLILSERRKLKIH